MTGSIICGVDDSESAKCAARVARGLSSKLGLRPVFVHAVDPGSADEKISAIAERLERRAGARPRPTPAPVGSLTSADRPAAWSPLPPTRRPG